MENHQWPANVSRAEANSLDALVKRTFHDKDNILWIRLTDYKYPRTALLLPRYGANSLLFVYSWLGHPPK